MDTKQLRADSYSLLKALLIPLVVLAHITVMYTPDGVYACVTGSRLLRHLTNYIYSFHMPAFFMASGCVYGLCVQAGKYRKIGSFLCNKSRRLLLPYLLFGVAYVVPVVYLCGLSKLTVPQAWVNDILLAKSPRHLWYVLVLFEIFLVTVPLRKLCEKTPWLPFAAALVLFAVLQPVFFGHPDVLQYKNLVTYQVYFFLGVLLDFCFDALRRTVSKYWYLWFLFPLAQLGCLFFRPEGLASYYVRMGFGLLGCIGTLTLMVILAEKLPKLQQSRLLKSLGACGYGIYLLHPMMIYGIYYFACRWTLNPLLVTAGSFVLVLALSWTLTALWRTVVKNRLFQRK